MSDHKNNPKKTTSNPTRVAKPQTGQAGAPRGIVSTSDSLDSISSINLDSRLNEENLNRWTQIQGLVPETESLNQPFRGYVPNCVGFFIHCETHKRVLLSKAEKATLQWIPFVPLKSGESVEDAADNGIHSLLSPHDVIKGRKKTHTRRLIEIFRVQIPSSTSFISDPSSGGFARLAVFEIKLKADDTGACCPDILKGSKLVWSTLDEMEKGLPFKTKLFGAEPLIYARGLNTHLREVMNINEDLKVRKDKERTVVKELMKGVIDDSSMTASDTDDIYTEVLDHFYPSSLITYPSFATFMKKIFPGREDYRGEFLAFSLLKNNYLTYHEVYVGLCAMIADHKENRLRYIFRYYDIDRNGVLNDTEIHAMADDLVNAEAKGADASERTAQIVSMLGPKASLSNFLKAVSQKKLRGTSSLFQLPDNAIQKFIETFKAKFISTQSAPNEPLFDQSHHYPGICDGCHSIVYENATHITGIGDEGEVDYVEPIPNVVKETKPPPNSARELMKRHSLEVVFGNTNIVFALMEIISKPYHVTKHVKKQQANPGAKNVVKEDKLDASFALQVCKRVEQTFQSEPRVLAVQSSTYIIGSLDGNLNALMNIERNICKKSKYFLSYIGNV